jgi:pyruvate formate lyase activating enzyme
VVLKTYGFSSGFCIDPIEKKPLNHFYPGTPVLSFGTAGCNLSCSFCQNWDISKSRQVQTLSDRATPDQIARTASRLGCRSIAYTYNDPVVFIEYAIDVAEAAREHGIKSVAVTAGYICEIPRVDFFSHMDAANVDLKSFNEDFYWKLAKGHLQPVLDTLLYLKQETNVWFEITTLLIPGENDTDLELDALTNWVVEHLGPETPLHFTAFHPDYRLVNKPRTSQESLQRACSIARKNGIQYAYTGNVSDLAGQSTYCHKCGVILIERNWYVLGSWNLEADGSCSACGALCAGRFDSQPGTWGSKRQPVSIDASDVTV